MPCDSPALLRVTTFSVFTSENSALEVENILPLRSQGEAVSLAPDGITGR